MLKTRIFRGRCVRAIAGSSRMVFYPTTKNRHFLITVTVVIVPDYGIAGTDGLTDGGVTNTSVLF